MVHYTWSHPNVRGVDRRLPIVRDPGALEIPGQRSSLLRNLARPEGRQAKRRRLRQVRQP